MLLSVVATCLQKSVSPTMRTTGGYYHSTDSQRGAWPIDISVAKLVACLAIAAYRYTLSL